MDIEDEIPVRILAATDAALLPVRDWTTHANANRHIALERLPVGVEIRVGGFDKNRKSGERMLNELHESGVLRITRSGRGKWPFARLSREADDQTRANAGLPVMADSLKLLARIAELDSIYPPSAKNLRWLPEIDLTDGRGWGETATPDDTKDLAFNELIACPAASAGYVRMHSSVSGHVCFSITPEGRAELAAPSPKPPTDLSEHPDWDELNRLYFNERAAKLREMQKVRPERAGEIGECPLVACLCGSRRYQPRKATRDEGDEGER